MAVTKGRKVKNITFAATDEELCDFNQLKGKWLVLYFYPKDNTSGCSKEAEDFSSYFNRFKRKGITIIGVSRDSIKSHHKFIAKLNIPFALISDPDEELCQYFDVMKEKSMYGRKYMGIERSTFIIDAEGKLRHEARNVKVPGHVEEIWQIINELKQA